MKKNILTIVIMAATLINLILSAVLVFSVMPAMNKTSSLVDKVASVIDLEIEDSDGSSQDYTMNDLLPYTITYDTSVKINLQQGSDGKAHYAVLDGIVVWLNQKADDYSDVNATITQTDAYVQDIVKETIAEYTVEQIDQEKIKSEAVKKLQEKYNTKSIVNVSLTGFLTA